MQVCSFNNEPICMMYVSIGRYILINPIPCSEISKAAFIVMCWLKHAVRQGSGFQGAVRFRVMY